MSISKTLNDWFMKYNNFINTPKKVKTQNFQIEIIQGNIGELKKYDIVVNAANKELRKGGGVCGVIYDAAGPELDEFMADEAPPVCTIGSNFLSPGFELCDYILHTVGPIYSNHYPDTAERLLRQAYSSCFKTIEEDIFLNQSETIVFPLISTGIYGYPIEQGIKIALEEIINKKEAERFCNLTTVTIICYTQADYELVQNVYETIKTEKNINN